jgi:hypothetical protein
VDKIPADTAQYKFLEAKNGLEIDAVLDAQGKVAAKPALPVDEREAIIAIYLKAADDAIAELAKAKLEEK